MDYDSEYDECRGCGAEVTSDGHNGLVHVEGLKYGCDPKAPRNGRYPVAH